MELEPPSGQTEHEITMERNPAYDVVNVITTTEVEEVRGGRSRLGNVKEEPNVSTFLFCINLI